MVIARPDVNLFHEVAKLPSEVVAILVIYQTVCYQSYYISHLLKDRSFDNSIKCTYNRNFEKHEGSDVPGVGYSECDCNMFRITLENLKKGIDKWNIYPKPSRRNSQICLKLVGMCSLNF